MFLSKKGKQCVCVCPLAHLETDFTAVTKTIAVECVIKQLISHAAELRRAGGECTDFNQRAPSSSQHHPSPQNLQPLLTKIKMHIRFVLLSRG